MPSMPPIDPDLEPFTGSWTCGLCLEVIPVTVYGRRSPDGITFVASPWPMADVHWHIEFHHPDGMD